jgi:hypothetical protein
VWIVTQILNLVDRLYVCFPRLIAAGTRFGSAVQTKGFGSALVSATKRLMVSCRSTTDWNTPRLRRWRVSFAQNSSTALSQDAEVRVKWSRQDDGGAPHVLLRCAAVGDDRLKLTAIHSGDVHHNDKSLNCFGRVGNRPEESDH